MARRGWLASDTWETIFGLAYLVFGTNAFLTMMSLPLIIVLITTDPLQSWPLLALTAVLAAPALAGAFGAFRSYSVDKDGAIAHAFMRTWRRLFWRSLLFGVISVGALVIAGVDFVAAQHLRYGAVIIPIVTVFAILANIAALLGLVASVERPESRIRDALRVGLYFGVRRWYLTLVSAIAFVSLAALFLTHPALGLGLAASPLLYAVWGNSRYSLQPVLAPSGDGAA